jgi:hypothetical protein
MVFLGINKLLHIQGTVTHISRHDIDAVHYNQLSFILFGRGRVPADATLSDLFVLNPVLDQRL